jgi:hypothetical protein
MGVPPEAFRASVLDAGRGIGRDGPDLSGLGVMTGCGREPTLVATIVVRHQEAEQ